MFNIGGGELIVIALVALIVLGPERLPGALRQVGSVMGQVRKMSASFQTDFKSALAQAEREAERESERDRVACGEAPSTAPLVEVQAPDTGLAEAIETVVEEPVVDEPVVGATSDPAEPAAPYIPPMPPAADADPAP